MLRLTPASITLSSLSGKLLITGEALLKGLSYRNGGIVDIAMPISAPAPGASPKTTNTTRSPSTGAPAVRSNGASSVAFSALAGAAGVLAAAMLL